jgi:ATP synthase protein I
LTSIMPTNDGDARSDAGPETGRPKARPAAAVAAESPRDPWSDDAPPRRLTREEAQALSQRLATVSPWRVVGAQCAVGCLVAAIAFWVAGTEGAFWSALYGAAVVVVPGALMARGLTSPLSRMSPGAGVVSFMLWEFVKIGVSVAMLALAPKWVPGLSWPALLAGLVLCIKVYWLALLWRQR